jgi:hypothetical protein
MICMSCLKCVIPVSSHSPSVDGFTTLHADALSQLLGPRDHWLVGWTKDVASGHADST